VKLDSELVDPYHQEPATEYGTRKGRQREAKERLEDAAVDMMAEPIAACIKSKKMLAWAPPAERPRRLRARSESTDQSMATATPMQIDGQVPALRGGTFYMTPTTEREYDNCMRSIQAPEKWLRPSQKVAMPRPSLRSPINRGSKLRKL